MENNLKKLDDKYIIEGEISQTKNSKIYYGYLINNPQDKIVIKIFKSTNFIKSNFENLLFEMKKLNNNNISLIINGGNGMIKSLNTIIKSNVYYIISEYQSKGDLFPYISYCEKGFGEEISKLLFCQILSGLNFYINNGIFLDKIKFDNILLDKDYKIKLSDFFLENINYKSAFNIKNYDLASILFSLVTGRDPKILGKKLTKDKLDKFWLSVKINNINIDNLSKEFFDLFNKIILENDFIINNIDINENINLPNSNLLNNNYYQKILSHPWFNNIKIENILLNKNNCYDIVKKEFEQRYYLINNKNTNNTEFLGQDALMINTMFNQINVTEAPLIERIGNKKFLPNKTDNYYNKSKKCFHCFKNIFYKLLKKNYFSNEAKCLKYKKFLNNSIKIIHVNLGKLNCYEYMERIVKICKQYSRIELTNSLKLKIYCYLNENEEEILIVKISLIENANNYDLIIQKITGNNFEYMNFSKKIIAMIEKI